LLDVVAELHEDLQDAAADGRQDARDAIGIHGDASGCDELVRRHVSQSHGLDTDLAQLLRVQGDGDDIEIPERTGGDRGGRRGIAPPATHQAPHAQGRTEQNDRDLRHDA